MNIVLSELYNRILILIVIFSLDRFEDIVGAVTKTDFKGLDVMQYWESGAKVKVDKLGLRQMYRM